VFLLIHQRLIRSPKWIFVWICLTIGVDSGQSFADSKLRLADAIDSLLNTAHLKGTKIGVQVAEVPGGKLVYQRNSKLSFIPASNMKLLVMAAALEMLGEDYSFQTTIALNGEDLVIIGSGDPTIGSVVVSKDPMFHFRQWVNQLKQRGITVLRGNLVLDATKFDSQFVHPNWRADQLHRSFASPIGALSLSRNCIAIAVHPARTKGFDAKVEMIPPYSRFRLRGNIQTSGRGKKHLWSAYRHPEGEVVLLKGQVQVNSTPPAALLPVDDPSDYFGTSLMQVLDQESIRLEGNLKFLDRSAHVNQLSVQIIHQTALSSVLALLGKQSDNHAAEQLFKTLGAEFRNQQLPGSWRTGREACLTILKRLNMPAQGVVIDDGSGLSRNNLVTASAITDVLVSVYSKEYRTCFLESLAVAGVDGTMRKRLRQTSYRGRVFAKTGTLNSVRTLSGFIHARNGKWYAFSFLANNLRRSVRKLQNDFCRVIIDGT